MKVVIRVVATLIGVCMLAISFLIFFKSVTILFTRESADYLSVISNVNQWFSVLFFIGYLFLTISIYKKFSYSASAVILLLFCLWLLNGRVMAFKAFPEGRVIAGWYYVETKRFNLCPTGFDCESIIFKESKVDKLSFWRIRISNKQVDEIIFVGPFTWNECIGVFERYIKKQ